jgi:hypothetical protein
MIGVYIAPPTLTEGGRPSGALSAVFGLNASVNKAEHIDGP